jgi:superfamily II DNA or RNA helicase
MGITMSESRCPNVARFEDDGSLSKNPNHDVWICNTQRLQGEALLRSSFARDFFDVVLIDEAHHAEAFSYRLIRDHFQGAKFLLLTATPFRGDEKQIDAETIYTCTMTHAIEMRYLKNVCYAPIVIDTVLGIQKDGKSKVLKGKELSGMANELYKVSLHSEQAIAVVMSVAMKRVRELRTKSSNAVRHQMILQATDLAHMAVLIRVWKNHPDNLDPAPEDKKKNEGGLLSIDYVASSRGDSINQKVLDQLKSGNLDAIVHVGMLGEGFDHPPLSICCIFRRFGSFAPYAQFVGRVVRRIKGGHGAINDDDGDNKGYIVAHPALGLDRHWKVFSEADEQFPDDKLLKAAGGGSVGSRDCNSWKDLQDHVLSQDQTIDEKWFI